MKKNRKRIKRSVCTCDADLTNLQSDVQIKLTSNKVLKALLSIRNKKNG